VLPYLAGLALVAAGLTGLFTWGVARRYGRRRALLVPLLALGAILFLMARSGTSGVGQGQLLAAFAVTLAGAAVAGGLVGLLFAPPRRG
jgi:NADH:ubiquinone oxidoreductase subunit K